jgi:hypothetical protein
MAAPGMAAAVFVPAAEKVMVSMHIEAPSFQGAIDISKSHRNGNRI